MASIVWVGVFFLLILELFITAILVLPLPRAVRRFIARRIFTYDLAKRVRFVSNFIVLGLILAVGDAVSTLRHLMQKEEDADEKPGQFSDARVGYIGASFDKQRKFRAERNMYLSGFALTLMFVIARLVELMQETANVEEEKEALATKLKDVTDRASNISSIQTTATSPAEDGPTSTLRHRSTATNTDKRD